MRDGKALHKQVSQRNGGGGWDGTAPSEHGQLMSQPGTLLPRIVKPEPCGRRMTVPRGKESDGLRRKAPVHLIQSRSFNVQYEHIQPWALERELTGQARKSLLGFFFALYIR